METIKKEWKKFVLAISIIVTIIVALLTPIVLFPPTPSVGGTPQQTQELHVDGDSYSVDWEEYPDTNDYLRVDETIASPDDTDYVYCPANYPLYYKENFTLQNWYVQWFPSDYDINVTVYARLKASGSGTTCKIMLYGSYYSGALSLTTVYKWYTYTWTTNPSTGVEWTYNDINGTAPGVYGRADSANTYVPYCSCVAVRVYYGHRHPDTPAAGHQLLYVASRTTDFQTQTCVGTSPYEDVRDYPTNYIKLTLAQGKEGKFDFADTTFIQITNVTLEVFALQDESAHHWYFNLTDGSTWTQYDYVFGTTWTDIWHWHTVAYVSTFLNTPTKVNAAQLIFKPQYGVGSFFDCIRLNVTGSSGTPTITIVKPDRDSAINNSRQSHNWLYTQISCGNFTPTEAKVRCQGVNYTMTLNGATAYKNLTSLTGTVNDIKFFVNTGNQWISKAYNRTFIMNCTTTTLNYKQFYYWYWAHTDQGSGYSTPDQFPHEQDGASGTDTGIWNATASPINQSTSYCAGYVMAWYDNTTTIGNSYVINNVYIHMWWNSAQPNTTDFNYVGWHSKRLNDATMYNATIFDGDATSKRHLYFTVGGALYNNWYLDCAYINLANSPYIHTFNDSLIYQFSVRLKAGITGQPCLVSMVNASTFIILNLPSNSTLQGLDSDGDTWNDYQELFINYTNPFNADTDGDGIPDNWDADPLDTKYGGTLLSVGWNAFSATLIDVGHTLGQVNISLNLDNINWIVCVLEYTNGTRYVFVYGYTVNANIQVTSIDNKFYIWCTTAGIWNHNYG
jgi:hypothetical protein